MDSLPLHPTRIHPLNRSAPKRGAYVLYWMQQSQRAEENHALEYAVGRANEMRVPLLVCFGVMDHYPEATYRHYRFMFEGLPETAAALADRGISFVLRRGNPDQVALDIAADAAVLVCDRGYLRHQRLWRDRVAREAPCQVVEVESDLVVPVETVSNKAEYAARTLRPKIHRMVDAYCVALPPTPVDCRAAGLEVEGVSLNDIEALSRSFDLDHSGGAVTRFFKGGTAEAKKRFAIFLLDVFSDYSDHSNQPQTDSISHMSPYLHFGQISPLYLALEVQRLTAAMPAAAEALLEQLIVRRELAANFTWYTPDYDRFECLPAWAQTTLETHRQDRREIVYAIDQLEAAQTHDPYWNAAMREMRYTGFMHNYMRMYWGKKILEWSASPREAFQTTLALNNKYFIDGRDPNSYTGVAWLYGVHDRAWKERPILGKIRYMAASGLERKCDIHAYVRKVDRLVAEAGRIS